MKKILLVATGGTIASTASTEGLAPAFNAEQLLSYLPEIKGLCRVDGICAMRIDSTNMTPSLMARIAETIYRHYHDYEGFVVTHGTDTMGYTSAALTYMLQNIKKPVVVTGSQLAIEAPDTDAKQNLADAILFALEDNAGIFVAFDGQIINGTRAVKLKTQSFDAFASVNFPKIADIKLGKITYNNALTHGGQAGMIAPDPKTPFILRNRLCDDIFLLKISPCIKPDVFDYLKENYKGIIVESFGIGGIPSEDIDIVSKLEELIQAGVAVVIATQCLEEGIDLDVYEVGQNLAKLELIYAGDMNSEAIVAKLMWALGNLDAPAEVKSFMERPVFGDRNR
jgi:L-asparaginase